jgi:hypothetical protein
MNKVTKYILLSVLVLFVIFIALVVLLPFFMLGGILLNFN